MEGTVSNDLQRRQQSGEAIATKKLSPLFWSGYSADNKFERSKKGEPLGVVNTSSHSEICYAKANFCIMSDLPNPWPASAIDARKETTSLVISDQSLPLKSEHCIHEKPYLFKRDPPNSPSSSNEDLKQSVYVSEDQSPSTREEYTRNLEPSFIRQQDPLKVTQCLGIEVIINGQYKICSLNRQIQITKGLRLSLYADEKLYNSDRVSYHQFLLVSKYASGYFIKVLIKSSFLTFYFVKFVSLQTTFDSSIRDLLCIHNSVDYAAAVVSPTVM